MIKQYGTYNSNSYVINYLCSLKPPVISAVGKPAAILSQEVLYLKLKHSRSPCIAGGLFAYTKNSVAAIRTATLKKSSFLGSPHSYIPSLGSFCACEHRL